MLRAKRGDNQPSLCGNVYAAVEVRSTVFTYQGIGLNKKGRESPPVRFFEEAPPLKSSDVG